MVESEPRANTIQKGGKHENFVAFFRNNVSLIWLSGIFFVFVIIPVACRFYVQWKEVPNTAIQMKDLSQSGYRLCISYPDHLVANLPEMQQYQMVFWFQAEECQSETIAWPPCEAPGALIPPTLIPLTPYPTAQLSPKGRTHSYEERCEKALSPLNLRSRQAHNQAHDVTFTVTITTEEYVLLEADGHPLQSQHTFTTTSWSYNAQVLSVSVLPLLEPPINQTWLEYNVSTSYGDHEQDSLHSKITTLHDNPLRLGNLLSYRPLRNFLSIYVGYASWIVATILPLIAILIEIRHREIESLITRLKDVSSSSRVKKSPEYALSEYCDIRSKRGKHIANDSLEKALKVLEHKLLSESVTRRILRYSSQKNLDNAIQLYENRNSNSDVHNGLLAIQAFLYPQTDIVNQEKPHLLYLFKLYDLHSDDIIDTCIKIMNDFIKQHSDNLNSIGYLQELIEEKPNRRWLVYKGRSAWDHIPSQIKHLCEASYDRWPQQNIKLISEQSSSKIIKQLDSLNLDKSPFTFTHIGSDRVSIPDSLLEPSASIANLDASYNTQALAIRLYNYAIPHSTSFTPLILTFPIWIDLPLRFEDEATPSSMIRMIAITSAQYWIKLLVEYPHLFWELSPLKKFDLAQLLLWHAGSVQRLRLQLEQTNGQASHIDKTIQLKLIKDAKKRSNPPSTNLFLQWLAIRPDKWEHTFLISVFGNASSRHEAIHQMHILNRISDMLKYHQIYLKILIADSDLFTELSKEGAVEPVVWSTEELHKQLNNCISYASSEHTIENFDELVDPFLLLEKDVQSDLINAANGSLGRLFDMGNKVIENHDPKEPYLQKEDFRDVIPGY